MKLLNICIPTYNRHNELIHLWDSFLSLVNGSFHADVDIYIFDNSDDEIAKKNKDFFDDKVYYKKNKTNIGFSLNVLQCTLTKTSQFLWCLSDNDHINFQYLNDILLILKHRDIDCLFLPFSIIDFLNEKKFHKENSYNSLKEFIQKENRLPFILLSNAIIKNNHFDSEKIQELFSDNSFIQIPIFIDKIGINGKIHVFDYNVIDYQYEYNGRFNINELYNSQNKIIDFIHYKYKFNECIKSNSKIQIAHFVLLHSVGLIRIHEFESTKKVSLSNFKKNILSFKYIILTTILFFPISLRKRIVAFNLTKSYFLKNTKFGIIKFRYLISKMNSNE